MKGILFHFGVLLTKRTNSSIYLPCWLRINLFSSSPNPLLGSPSKRGLVVVHLSSEFGDDDDDDDNGIANEKQVMPPISSYVAIFKDRNKARRKRTSVRDRDWMEENVIFFFFLAFLGSRENDFTYNLCTFSCALMFTRTKVLESWSPHPTPLPNIHFYRTRISKRHRLNLTRCVPVPVYNWVFRKRFEKHRTTVKYAKIVI